MSELKIQTPIEDFDWDAYENGNTAGSKSREELASTYDESLKTAKENEVVTGTVKSITKREVRVDIGMKSDAIIPVSEFRYNPDLKVGDEVEVYIETLEDKNGQLRLSHKKACQTRSWDRVNEALQNDEVIKGYVKSRTKGGMIVDVFGIEAFLPGSQIDVRPIRDYDVFVDKTMEFKVVKINQEYKNVVVSHKALIEAELEQQKKEIISKLEKGQVLEGKVKNITAYGVFVDLGGVDGLVHITDLSWGRVSDPHEVVELDQDIKVVILDFDNEKKRIALGIKQLVPHPWDNLDQTLKVGDHVRGRVVVMADYGAFVEVQPGVEGLIHVSEMSWSQHLRSAQDFLKAGDEVEAVVLTLDREERKMSLGLKQLKKDPWEDIETKYAIGRPPHRESPQLHPLRRVRRDRRGSGRSHPHLRPQLDKENQTSLGVHTGGQRHRGAGARDRQGQPSSLARPQAARRESLGQLRVEIHCRLNPSGNRDRSSRQGRCHLA